MAIIVVKTYTISTDITAGKIKWGKLHGEIKGSGHVVGYTGISKGEEEDVLIWGTSLNDELALGSIRITVGRWTKEEDIDQVIEMLVQSTQALRV